MTPSIANVPESELAVLRLLWADGQSSIRTLTDKLYPDGGVAHYATVQKLLDRLEAKGLVVRDRSGSKHLFSAAVDRETMLREQLRELAKAYRQPSMVPLVAQLLEVEPLSADDRKRLRDILEKVTKKRSG